MFATTPSVDWFELFGNEHPVEIEVGSGKGAFLLAAARARPGYNFLGIEIQARWVRLVHQRLGRHGIGNVHMLQADAGIVIRHFVPDASVAAYHVYFPDPWWKRRHWRRLFIRPEVAREIRRTLAPGGRLSLATDVEERFHAMLSVLRDAGLVVVDDPSPDRPTTNFERKYRAEGRRVYHATLARNDEDGERR